MVGLTSYELPAAFYRPDELPAAFDACNPIRVVLASLGYTIRNDSGIAPGQSVETCYLQPDGRSYHYDPRDILYDVNEPYTSFRILARINHMGNATAANEALEAEIKTKQAAAAAVAKTRAENALGLTDTDNGERLAARHGGDLLHSGALGWLVWDGARHRYDDTEEIYRRAKDTARSIYAEAAQAGDDKQAKTIAMWAHTSLGASRLDAMIRMATSVETLKVHPSGLDAQPWLLNVANGTLDLRTGKLGEHKRSDLLTKISPVPYIPGAKCAMWLDFLNTIFDCNEALIAFVQKALGYTLTGATTEQCLFIPYGTGANGKTTLLETARNAMGEYSQQAEFSTFLTRRDEGPRNDIARMVGARLVVANESGEGRRLNEPIVKSLTGGDSVTARFLNKEFFEFRPQFKLWLATNHKPSIHGTDEGIWRRIRLIPFDVAIPKENRDTHLIDKLRGELPGILAWMVRGCLQWQREGLGEPEKVTDATKGYRAEQDELEAFLAECCVKRKNLVVNTGNLHKAYQAWGGTDSPRTFGLKLKAHGFNRVRGTNGVRIWEGIGLLDDQNLNPNDASDASDIESV